MTSRVFVVQEPIAKRHGRPARRFSLAPAQKYGELVFVLDWSDTRDLGLTDGETEADVLWKIRQRMEGYNCGDYILMTGNWTAMAMTVAVALEETGGGPVRCLQWDKDDGYRVVTIDMNAPPPGLLERED